MAEDFNDFGSYRRQLEDEEFKSRSVIGKIFSFRALKFLIKWIGYSLIILVFALLLWRIFSSKLPKAASQLIWTEQAYSSYEELGKDLLIYTQDVGTVFDKDGKFSLYSLHYIPAVDEIQFTVRYNKSTLDKLAEELTEQAQKELGESFTDADIVTAESFTEMPFAFKLRDNLGRIYTDYEYTTFEKGRYVYVRIAFSGVDVFDLEKQSPTVNLPIPEVSNPDYIYKGVFSSEYLRTAIETIYVDSYYVGDYTGDPFADPIVLYRSGRDMEVYKNERPSGVTKGLTTVIGSELSYTVKEDN